MFFKSQLYASVAQVIYWKKRCIVINNAVFIYGAYLAFAGLKYKQCNAIPEFTFSCTLARAEAVEIYLQNQYHVYEADDPQNGVCRVVLISFGKL